MVDYSKWDRFEDSSNDDDDDRHFSPPRVTRLDALSTITTPADGTIRISPNQIEVTAGAAAAAAQIQPPPRGSKKRHRKRRRKNRRSG
jgi:hypothetical protein